MKQRVLGIDPGTVVMGFGVIDRDGSAMTLVDLFSWRAGRPRPPWHETALRRGLSVAEYPPAVVKRRISGRGAASKEQLAGFLNAMFAIPVDPKRALDATDALAVAACHALTVDRAAALSRATEGAGGPPAKKKSAAKGRGAWAQFLAQNPDRTK